MATIELFGNARVLAGQQSIKVDAASVREALAALARACPAIVGPVLDPDGAVTPAYALNVNGTHFVSGLDEPLQPSDTVLVLSSMSGG